MNRASEKPIDDAEPPAPERPGKVEFDSRGNSVWRWARDVVESTSVLLKRLENKDLALEPTRNVPVMRAADAAGKQSPPHRPGANVTPQSASKHPAMHPEAPSRDSAGGFDPYNTR